MLIDFIPEAMALGAMIIRDTSKTLFIAFLIGSKKFLKDLMPTERLRPTVKDAKNDLFSVCC